MTFIFLSFLVSQEKLLHIKTPCRNNDLPYIDLILEGNELNIEVLTSDMTKQKQILQSDHRPFGAYFSKCKPLVFLVPQCHSNWFVFKRSRTLLKPLVWINGLAQKYQLTLSLIIFKTPASKWFARAVRDTVVILFWFTTQQMMCHISKQIRNKLHWSSLGNVNEFKLFCGNF